MSFICIICRDVLKSNCEDSKDENQLVIVATKCGHLFHLPCLSNWFHQCWKIADADSHPRCPCCKTMSYVHELVRLYPAQESTVADGIARIPPSKIDCASAKVSTTVAALNKNYKTLNEDFKAIKSSNAAEKSNVHDKSFKCMESMEEDLEKLQHDFEELSAICKSSEAKWESKQEKQRQEIIYLKHQNQKLVKEIKYKINCPTTRNQDYVNADDSIKNSRIILKDPSSETSRDNDDNYADESTPFRDPSQRLQTDVNVNNTHPSRVNSNEDSYASLKPGDKVVWILNENPETGIVKWKGFVGSRIYAGIEFERHLGIPIGDAHTDTESLQYIFRFKAGHGRLVPAQELIRYEQYYSDGDSKLKSRKLSLQKLKLHSCSQQ